MSAFKVALIALDGQPGVPDWVTDAFVNEGVAFVAQECRTRNELTALAADADVVWVFGSHQVLTAENLDVIPNCGAIIRSGSGTDNIPVAEATERGILVANTPDAISDTVADHAIGLLFAVVRQIPTYDRSVRNGKWDRHIAQPAWTLQNGTLGLIGFGHVARQVARKLSGFNMRILAHDPYVKRDVMEAYGVCKSHLEEVLAESDFISIHCALTAETHHLMDVQTLQQMKRSAILINTSRGPVVSESALLQALTEGWIAAAGLDVVYDEPPDPANPLLGLDNIVVTPHIAAYSDKFVESFWRYSLETALDLAKGRWPRSYVNPTVKPRWQLS